MSRTISRWLRRWRRGGSNGHPSDPVAGGAAPSAHVRLDKGTGRALTWRESHWGDGIAAKGASGYYLIWGMAECSSGADRYIASYRACFGQEPRYIGRFTQDAAGLQAAMQACQARETTTRAG